MEIFPHPAEYFLEGAAAIGTYSGRHFTVYFFATGHRPSYSSFSLERRVLGVGRLVSRTGRGSNLGRLINAPSLLFY
jgi:hypothetical protein